MKSPRVLISAAHKSSGKTTITMGLSAALVTRGLRVHPFKKGPDYIDPMWLTAASRHDCHNLDPYLTTVAAMTTSFVNHSVDADVCLIEGNKGLYDGLSLDGSNSNAAVAHALGLPVVLVIDARGMTRGIAPLLLGYQAFDRDLNIAGVILNNLGGARHEAKLRAVIEHYTDIPVIGAVQRDSRLAIDERHLGLMPSMERDDAMQKINIIGEIIASQVDLDRVLEIAAMALPQPYTEPSAVCARQERPVRHDILHHERPLCIGVARDKAFGFYYAEDLAALDDAGMTLVFIDTIIQSTLPEIDGLIIGGGFPEVFMGELAANISLRHAIANAIREGLPAYAECGGLMYLSKSLTWRGRTCEMAGVIPGDTVMHERPVGRGYVHLEATGNLPWNAGTSTVLKGHEFHYSSLENLPDDMRYGWRVQRGHGVDGQHDGILLHNLVASYTHLRGVDNWVGPFVAFVRQQARRREVMRSGTGEAIAGKNGHAAG